MEDIKFMYEKYKGYGIQTGWNNNTTGFDFRIYDPAGKTIGMNELSYFYEDNAMAAAKQAVDTMLEELNQQP